MRSAKTPLYWTAAISAALACVAGVAMLSRGHARRQHDRAVVARFVVAARRGQETRPCGVAVERVAQISQQGKALRVPSCSGKSDAAETRRLADGYLQLVKAYDGIAAEVSRVDASISFAESEATSHLIEIGDPELKRAVADARTALSRRNRVTGTLLEDWRKLSHATSEYAARVDAGLLRGDKAACVGLERGVPAKSPADILVTCHKEFERARNELDAKLAHLERSPQE